MFDDIVMIFVVIAVIVQFSPFFTRVKNLYFLQNREES